MGLLITTGLHEGSDLLESVRRFMEEAEGAYSVILLTSEGDLIAFRDPCGIRPLWMGEGHSLAFSSETVGLDINSLRVGGEVLPGDAVVVTREGEVLKESLIKSRRRALCAFEFAYFSRPDSILGGKHVYLVREQFGRLLARENPDIVSRADIILSAPDTADDAAYGLHEETGLRWERALRRHRYVVQRAFILSQGEREIVVSKKTNMARVALRGKRVILVDDSIVRGDTTRNLVRKLKEAGASEVHVLITFPKIISPCFYGIDMATYEELIAVGRTEEDIAREVGADSVRYLSIDSFVKATGMGRDELCLACVTGRYPTPKAQKIAELAKSRIKPTDVRPGRIYERRWQ